MNITRLTKEARRLKNSVGHSLYKIEALSELIKECVVADAPLYERLAAIDNINDEIYKSVCHLRDGDPKQ